MSELADGRRISAVGRIGKRRKEVWKGGEGVRSPSRKAAKAAVPCFSVPNFKGKRGTRGWNLPYPVDTFDQTSLHPALVNKLCRQTLRLGRSAKLRK
jgi:hypothetical protein